MALTRADIAERLIIKEEMGKGSAQEFVDSFFEIIADTLGKGECETYRLWQFRY